MKYKDAIRRVIEAGGNVQEFEQWLYGQTGYFDDNGDICLYDYDVMRFIYYKVTER